MIVLRNIFVLFCLFISANILNLNAQTLSDSTVLHKLNEVEVNASRISSFQSTVPVQTLQAKDWIKMNVLQVSDVAKYFSGIQIKDYGGIGGLKTISIRSLGANYSGVSYDGIIVNDYQTGQSDLSRFSLENLQSLTLSIGENDDIFQTARHRASAGTLAMFSSAFSSENKKKEIKFAVKGGSFGLFNPLLSITTPLSKTFSMNVFGEYLQSEGNYPYKEITSYNPYTVSVKSRKNSDVSYYTIEANLAGKFNNGGKLGFKTNYYSSDRGYPGAATLHNTYSGERSEDQTVFSQANYSQKLNRLFDFQANAKFSYSSSDYVDRNNNNPGGIREISSDQHEYYLNMTWLYTASEKLSFSWANDGSYGDYNSMSWTNNDKEKHTRSPFPSRITWLSALSGKYEIPRFTLTGSLLNNFTEDREQVNNFKINSVHLSPYIGLSLKPLNSLPLRLRAYYKNTFRFPTMGDIYLSQVAYSISNNLKPENANQYNTGVTFATSLSDLIPYLSLSADVYNNRIKNKIVALPKNSMYIWSVQNYGEVDIKGLDLNLKTQLKLNEKFACNLSGAYTLQNVLDKTDKNSEMYNQQIPYTPHHIVSGAILLETPWVDVNYTLLYCGKRYYERVNRPEYQMSAYTDQSISLQKKISWKSYRLLLSAECLNFLDESYDVVRSYPMPGRSFRIKLIMNFK